MSEFDWIEALTHDERNAINNDALLTERYRVGDVFAHYRATIEHQQKQPASKTRDLLIQMLAGQVELINEELEQISLRQEQFRAWCRANPFWLSRGYKPAKRCEGEHVWIELPDEGPTAKRCARCGYVTGRFLQPEERTP